MFRIQNGFRSWRMCPFGPLVQEHAADRVMVQDQTAPSGLADREWHFRCLLCSHPVPREPYPPSFVRLGYRWLHVFNAYHLTGEGFTALHTKRGNPLTEGLTKRHRYLAKTKS